MYDRALAHAQVCPFREYPCELGCGKMIIKQLMEEHKSKCVNYEELCDKCEVVLRPN